ncbi:hypothetical protein CXB51_036393 [Gossypium anomalum]|uniref:Response regulatory domain-containing protein n=1 Tax=Gossypium anomalum TaxID=47600 RepID=A0A8J6CIG8_9ROSI|nr:hypothetical protein CXB51_036393 [Gossypium anomalum]
MVHRGINEHEIVLVVDGLTRRFNEMHIKKFGVKVQAVENGKQAVDLVRSGTSLNLNIKDQNMPVMDGLEKKLKPTHINICIHSLLEVVGVVNDLNQCLDFVGNARLGVLN